MVSEGFKYQLTVFGIHLYLSLFHIQVQPWNIGILWLILKWWCPPGFKDRNLIIKIWDEVFIEIIQTTWKKWWIKLRLGNRFRFDRAASRQDATNRNLGKIEVLSGTYHKASSLFIWGKMYGPTNVAGDFFWILLVSFGEISPRIRRGCW